MLPFRYVAVFALLALVSAQDFDYQQPARQAPSRVQPGYSGSVQQPKPTPIAILKQINRHNEDGSYTYGYEGADGSFKIETKLPTGEVKGKYGYVDDQGKVRVVEYGATKYGFEPSGEGITVAPPTLVDDTTKDGLLPQDDYAQYDQPQVRQRVQQAPRPRPTPAYEPEPQYQPAPQQYVQPRTAAVPRPQQSFSDFGFSPKPAPARNFAPAPAPARPSFGFANTAPAPIEEDNYEPAPVARPSPKITYAQPRPQPQPQFQFAPAATQPIARPQPQPQYAPAPRPSQSGGRIGGVLDQLAKDYALPQGGAAPLHDISFGYY